MERDVSVDNYSAVVTGILFAFLLPAQAPWWIVMTGSAISVCLGKMVFGGLGANPVASPLVGWAALQISWPDAMNINIAMLASPLENPLTQLKYLGLQSVDVSFMEMAIGAQLSGLGSAQVLALLAGGIFLAFRRSIRVHIPLAFLGGVLVASLIFWGIDSSVHPNPLFHILAGSTVFGAFFLATDPPAAPVGKISHDPLRAARGNPGRHHPGVRHLSRRRALRRAPGEHDGLSLRPDQAKTVRREVRRARNHQHGPRSHDHLRDIRDSPSPR
jgi:Na+-translocating ferredoxin:NAD+ oxidoreductase subunit D